MTFSWPRVCSRAIRVFGLVLFALSLSLAQQTPNAAAGDASISGTASDPTQAVVPDAKAVLTSATGQTSESAVNDKGVYSFTGLKPGIYKLVVSAPKFADVVFDNINLASGLELTLDATLQPAGASGEVIEVHEKSAGDVITENANLTTMVTSKQLQELHIKLAT